MGGAIRFCLLKAMMASLRHWNNVGVRRAYRDGMFYFVEV
jgi:hypothetical protein